MPPVFVEPILINPELLVLNAMQLAKLLSTLNLAPEHTYKS